MIEKRRKDREQNKDPKHKEWRGPRRIRKEEQRHQQFEHYPKKIIHAPKIDRSQTCPFLVRVFYSLNGENSYSNSAVLPPTELHLHLWMDTTLREIAELLRAMLPEVRTKQRFIFSKIMQGEGKIGWKKADLGTVILNRRGQKGGGEEKTLYTSNFYIGEYIDAAIHFK